MLYDFNCCPWRAVEKHILIDVDMMIDSSFRMKIKYLKLMFCWHVLCAKYTGIYIFLVYVVHIQKSPCASEQSQERSGFRS